VVTLAAEILASLNIGSFVIKLNHRVILDAVFEICGVPSDKFRAICSAVDKLDKSPWSEVRREMTEDKGLSEESADKIGTFVQRRGSPREMHAELMKDKCFGDHVGANKALEDVSLS
jgi:histidyl-tRNA synthetase